MFLFLPFFFLLSNKSFLRLSNETESVIFELRIYKNVDNHDMQYREDT